MLNKIEMDEIRKSISGIEDAIKSLKTKLDVETKMMDQLDDESSNIKVYSGLDSEMSSRINDIMDNFDFNKIHIVMELLNWKWVFAKTKSGIPTVDELKQFALDLLIRAAKEKTWMSSGGFRVQYEDCDENDDVVPFIQLEFVVESYDGCIYES